MRHRIPVPSVVAFAFPRWFVDRSAVADLDIEAFSRRFDWRQDKWDGFHDTIRPVAKTIDTETGDCEDYALVAASWCLAHDRPVRLGLCFEGWALSHVVAVDAERVYSSGALWNTDLDTYIEDSKYDSVLQRRV